MFPDFQRIFLSPLVIVRLNRRSAWASGTQRLVVSPPGGERGERPCCLTPKWWSWLWVRFCVCLPSAPSYTPNTDTHTHTSFQALPRFHASPLARLLPPLTPPLPVLGCSLFCGCHRSEAEKQRRKVDQFTCRSQICARFGCAPLMIYMPCELAALVPLIRNS